MSISGGSFRARSQHLPLFDYVQELRLQLEGQLADIIEEQGAAVCLHYSPDVLVHLVFREWRSLRPGAAAAEGGATAGPGCAIRGPEGRPNSSLCRAVLGQ